MEHVEQYGLAAVVIFIVVKETFSFVKWRNGRNSHGHGKIVSELCTEHEGRISSVEGIMEGVRSRLDRIEKKLDAVLIQKGPQ